MNISKFIPAVGVGSVGALGTAGAIKYKQKKDMEKEMYNTLMSLMPQDMPNHEREYMVNTIMKNSHEEDDNVDKLAQLLDIAKSALGEEVVRDILKEAAEDAIAEKEDIVEAVVEEIKEDKDDIVEEIVEEVVEEVKEKEESKSVNNLELLGRGFVEAVNKNEVPKEVLAAVQTSVLDILIKEASTELGLAK